VANSRMSGRKVLETSAARGTRPVRATTRRGPLRGPIGGGGYRHGKDLAHRYRGEPLFAAPEGKEDGQGQRREARRGRELGALLAQDAGRQLPQARTDRAGNHNLQAPAGALVRVGAPAEGLVRWRPSQDGASQREGHGEENGATHPAGSSKGRSPASAPTRPSASSQASAKSVKVLSPSP
jgi:hypothetical protein